MKYLNKQIAQPVEIKIHINNMYHNYKFSTYNIFKSIFILFFNYI